MPWNFYDASARYATLLTFDIIRPIPQRIMVAVSFTNVIPVRSISPRQKIQTPPDLVVKFQPIDITDVILWRNLRPHIVHQREIKGSAALTI